MYTGGACSAFRAAQAARVPRPARRSSQRVCRVPRRAVACSEPRGGYVCTPGARVPRPGAGGACAAPRAAPVRVPRPARRRRRVYRVPRGAAAIAYAASHAAPACVLSPALGERVPRPAWRRRRVCRVPRGGVGAGGACTAPRAGGAPSEARAPRCAGEGVCCPPLADNLRRNITHSLRVFNTATGRRPMLHRQHDD